MQYTFFHYSRTLHAHSFSQLLILIYSLDDVLLVGLIIRRSLPG